MAIKENQKKLERLIGKKVTIRSKNSACTIKADGVLKRLSHNNWRLKSDKGFIHFETALVKEIEASLVQESTDIILWSMKE